jgi:RNA polymerase sigma factor (sigma-70 family)
MPPTICTALGECPVVEGQTAKLQECIDRLQAGDAAARDDLVNRACARLVRLTRKMLKSHPGVHRWEETDDVFQNAMIRLHRALMHATPRSLRHFFNLATVQIRRELIDLGRHYYGPEGAGAHHDTGRKNEAGADTGREPVSAADSTNEPSRVAQWCEFHEQVEALPAQERAVVDLLWYHGLPQAEAAAVLGISERTLQRRWQAVRLTLYRTLDGALPE